MEIDTLKGTCKKSLTRKVIRRSNGQNMKRVGFETLEAMKPPSFQGEEQGNDDLISCHGSGAVLVDKQANTVVEVDLVVLQ